VETRGIGRGQFLERAREGQPGGEPAKKEVCRERNLKERAVGFPSSLREEKL